MSGFRIELPIPPSVNQAYRNVPKRGRVATEVLKQWKRDAGWEIHLAKREPVTGPYSVSILVPDEMPGDVDNRAKSAVDLLVAHKLTPDDKMARRVSSERSAEVPFGRCIVVVEAWKAS